VTSEQQRLGPGKILEDIVEKPKFPATDAAGTLSDKAKNICFNFTLEGHDGCKNRRCRFIHIDVESLSASDSALKLAHLTKVLRESKLGEKIEYTIAGSRASA
jgi:hypothetical protein